MAKLFLKRNLFIGLIVFMVMGFCVDISVSYALRTPGVKDAVTEELAKEIGTAKDRKIVKRIGILTGGGPASGHNEVIASVVEEAARRGIEVVPILQGWKGLVDDKLVSQSQKKRALTLAEAQAERIKGGTLLVTSRTNPYSKEGIEKGDPKKLWDNIQKLKLDGLITMGGDDTNSVSYQLQKEHPEFLIIGLPKTMDNDIDLPQRDAATYGFDSFVENATPAVEAGIIDAKATKRVLVVEVFGRSSGFVAARIGANVKASRTLIPEEKELDLEKLINDMIKFHKQNKYGSVIVSEGVNINKDFKNNAKILEAAFKADPLAKLAFEKAMAAGVDEFGNPKLENSGLIISAVLKAGFKEAGISISHAGKIDYLFRSADTSPKDLKMCNLLGKAAVTALVENKNNQMLYVHNDVVKPMELKEKLGGRRLDYRVTDKEEYLKANQALFNFADIKTVNAALKDIVEVTDTGVKVLNVEQVRGSLVDKLVNDATNNPDKEIVALCRKLIKDIAASQGAVLSSVYDKYVKKATDPSQRTFPAINIRGMAYNTARAMFESAVSNNVNDLIAEIAKSEMKYSGQSPDEYVASILAAAIKEGYNRPVYVQGDHFQISLDDYLKDPEKARENIKKLIREAIMAGFYQIDLDMSPLVDFSKATIDEQQKDNYTETAILTAYVRALEIEFGLDKLGITVNLGGEIGEIGKGLEKGRNSTVEDFIAFDEGYKKVLTALSEKAGYKLKPITKIAVQTGTKHGGIMNDEGKIEDAKVSFNTLAEIGKEARGRGYAGVVQHGASTLDPRFFVVFAGKPIPDGFKIAPELLDEANKEILSKNPVAEVHLATQYQNIIFDHPAFPKWLSAAIEKYIKQKFPTKKSGEEAKEYKENRKNAWGVFKLETSNLDSDTQSKIRESLKKEFDTVFKNLGVAEGVAKAADEEKVQQGEVAGKL